MTNKVNLMSPGHLAYVGDSVYELLVRNYLVNQGIYPLNKVHKNAVRLVNAAAQARGLRAIEDKLEDKEKAIVRRGRNFNSGSSPRNMKIADYRLSTGLEALFGYLYLNGNYDRIKELWSLLIKELEGE
ncbi:Mini-ribonuclease 3 [Halothermothrix orenii]|uniref:Mini-ribonuclease 3 n=1 Tax=Halothermothrix orenii (strain H 168 / OCM 544 / DSM 9562) TaxID=373903 RepID=B8D0A4_HALOH|nr:ribonuclease III domain-containing protein [Halothermothrix orenii]ACL68858.1 ribonuclease III [Halothermothrix orenii H 168]